MLATGMRRVLDCPGSTASAVSCNAAALMGQPERLHCDAGGVLNPHRSWTTDYDSKVVEVYFYSHAVWLLFTAACAWPGVLDRQCAPGDAYRRRGGCHCTSACWLAGRQCADFQYRGIAALKAGLAYNFTCACQLSASVWGHVAFALTFEVDWVPRIPNTAIMHPDQAFVVMFFVL
jgi:hypothetical protein